MRRFSGIAAASAALVAAAVVLPAPARAQETSRAVAGGGISVAGWKGKVDANEARRGMTIDNAKLVTMGPGMHVTTGPATTYWNPSNTASGDYTVKATFNEAKFMDLSPHPHPYGIVIAGNDMDSDTPSYLYCAAYGDGKFIVRGFAPGNPRGTFQMNGQEGEMNAAVHKAEAKGKPVQQTIAMSVKGDKVTCNINGTDVATYTKADLAAKGLKSLDGMYGIRFAHNTDAHVAGFTMTKP
ncbi:MAG TPA: hypothetical protein VG916_13575 [Gemmatimonadaceae bacterium]|nr:hypothetical protein [Gemmatimonadaceae bacterium]